MREVQFIIRDDFDGTPEATAVTFAVQGLTYEIDLSADNLAQLEEALAPYIKVARLAEGTPRKKGSTSGNNSNRARELIARGAPIPKYLRRTAELVRVRDWAESNGWVLKSRARIPNEVHEAYNNAHPDRPVQSK